MDNITRIIGYEHADADIDELDTLKTDDAAGAFRAILARNRQAKPDGSKNTIGVTTTPEGFRFVYQTWKKNPQEGYELIQAPTSSNPHLPKDYLDNLKKIYPEQLLAAYTEGHFVNLTSGTVYTGDSRDKNESREIAKADEYLLIGMDFNVTNMSAVIYKVVNGIWHAVDELSGVYDTPSMIRVINERYPKNPISIYPDASGASRKTVDASISDISLLERAGFDIRVNKRNPFVKDRVMAANSAFENLTVMVNSSKCPELVSNLEQLSYDKSGNPDKSANIDHLPDAATYPIAYELPINKPIAAVPFKFQM